MFFRRLIDVKAIRKSNIKTDVELFMKKNRLIFLTIHHSKVKLEQ
jgi:hypothetical protein